MAKKNAPRWPTLSEQLAKDKIIRGSALEQFITNNQEFDMLDPSEAGDKLPFPPWLRVYFRKNHPEIDFSGNNRGYPLLLKEIYHRMLRNQDLTGMKPGS
ncbi:MAG TPA: hypothetical protein VFE32_11110 [Puia sp.]|jgi:hypothetical protein|nr:hypothetical protein [Puia sp.]